MPELLAPAGDYNSLEAAVYAGADAVYLGLQKFNARCNAKNFDGDELINAYKLCRLFGVNIYLTLNTLCRSSGIREIIEEVKIIENDCPPNAYIVQDLGLAYQLKQMFPNITLHASTQLCIHNSIGSEALKNLGYSRAVLAREMSQVNIQSFCQNSGMEAEVFIHGAMCVSQSGGCLMSAMIGGRSGNCGDCAYPCRLPYSGKNPYPLSLKDLCLANHIPELKKMGIHSFKIEGRMKSPEYVYIVTSVYRKLIDENRCPNSDEMALLSGIFSRNGFTDGFFTDKKQNMFGVRTQKDKEKTRSINCKIHEKMLNIDIEADFSTNNPSKLTLFRDGIKVTVFGETVQSASNRPLTEKELQERLLKLGGTHFTAETAKITMDEEIYLPVSQINQLRRNAAEALTEEIISNNHRSDNSTQTKKFILKNEKLQTKNNLILRFEGNYVNSVLAKIAGRIDIPLWRQDLIDIFKGYEDKLCLILPRVIFDSDVAKIKNLLEKARINGIKKLLLPNITFIGLCRGFELHGDFTLNCINETSEKLMYSLGFSSIIASPEAPSGIGSIKIIYGKIPLMHTAACIITNISNCKNNNCSEVLVDRTNAKFPVFKSCGCSNTIYNSVPTWLFDKLPPEQAHCIFFTDEQPIIQSEIIKEYYDKKPPTSGFTRH